MKNSILTLTVALSMCLASPLSSFSQQRRGRTPRTTKPINIPASQPQPTAPEAKPRESQKPLNNADIVRMVKSGFGESVIINAIQTNETQYSVI